MRRELGLERRDKLTRLGVDGADAVETIVAPRDSRLDRRRNVQTLEHVVQERHDVLRSFGSTEGNDQDCVVIVRLVIEELAHSVIQPLF